MEDNIRETRTGEDVDRAVERREEDTAARDSGLAEAGWTAAPLPARQSPLKKMWSGILQGTGFGVVLILTILGLSYLLGGDVERERQERVAAQEQINVQFCESQAALAEMQRGFLQEHEDIRAGLTAAGVPHEHADPDLLDRLATLIDKADCDVDDDVKENSGGD